MCSRKSLPAEMISRNNFSVWSILKKCIGMVSLTCFLTKLVGQNVMQSWYSNSSSYSGNLFWLSNVKITNELFQILGLVCYFWIITWFSFEHTATRLVTPELFALLSARLIIIGLEIAFIWKNQNGLNEHQNPMNLTCFVTPTVKRQRALLWHKS